MTATPIDTYLERFEQLKAQRAPWEGRWRELARFLSPTRDDFAGLSAPSQTPQEPWIYDATAMNAAEALASALFGLLTNPAGRWFQISPTEAEQAQEVHDWFAAVGDRILLALQQDSGFYSQVPDFFRDLVCYGTAVFYVEAAAGGGLRFSYRPLAQMYIASAAGGQIDRIYRHFSLTARQVQASWGTKVAPGVLKAIDGGQGDRAVSLLHVVEPNPEHQPGKLGPSGKPYLSRYIDLDHAHIMTLGGYAELPYQVARWSTARGADYGTAPGFLALPDIRSLNAMAKTSLLAAQKAVDPPILVPHEVGMQGIKTHPGAVIVGGLDASGRRLYEPFTTGSDIKLGLEMEEQRRGAIRSAFLSGLLGLEAAPQMSATEFLGRQDERLRLMSPYLGRVQAEFLSPLLRRVFGLMQRAGRLPAVPEGLMQDSGPKSSAVKIAYLSPAARAQQTAEANAILRSYASLAPLAEADPSLLGLFDLPQAARTIAQAYGVPSGVLRGQNGH